MSKIAFENIVNVMYGKILGRSPNQSELDEIYALILSDVDNSLVVEKTLEILCESSDFKKLQAPNVNFLKVTDQDIFYAYKFILGRLPENDRIYEVQRRFGDVAGLVESLVASSEFKFNPILKDVISVKRKPIEFGDYISKSFNTSAARIIVLSGCQGKTLADYFQAKTGSPYVTDLFIGRGSTRRDFIDSHGKSHHKLLSGFDLIYTQKRDIFEILRSEPEFSGKVRLLPLIEYIGYQPDQCYIFDKSTKSIVLGPLGEYHSVIVASAYFSGVSVEDAAKLFTKTTYSLFDFEHRIKKSSLELVSQSSDTHYPMHELIQRWSSCGPWMRTINHPRKFVLGDLVDIALAREGIEILPGVDDFVTDDLAGNVDWPIYPELIEGDSSPALKFKLPKALAPYSTSAIFLDLISFIELTYKSLKDKSLEDIYCEQLGKHIDLFTTLGKP